MNPTARGDLPAGRQAPCAHQTRNQLLLMLLWSHWWSIVAPLRSAPVCRARHRQVSVPAHFFLAGHRPGRRVEEVQVRRKMPAVKLLYQSGESNSKPNYIMGHSCQALALLAKVGPFHHAIPLCARIHEGLVFSNRDKRTLLDKLLILLATLELSDPVLLVADAYYCSRKVIRGLLAKDGHLVSRLRQTACGFEPVPVADRPARGRPRLYGKKVKLRKLFKAALQTMASPADIGPASAASSRLTIGTFKSGSWPRASCSASPVCRAGTGRPPSSPGSSGVNSRRGCAPKQLRNARRNLSWLPPYATACLTFSRLDPVTQTGENSSAIESILINSTGRASPHDTFSRFATSRMRHSQGRSRWPPEIEFEAGAPARQPADAG